MTKADVIRQLHSMVDHRLFFARPWLADREAMSALLRLTNELRLEELADGEPGTLRTTELGKECSFELMMVFLGMWNVWEIPIVLEDCELLDEVDTDMLVDRLVDVDDPEPILRPLVQRAYFRYFNPINLKN